MRKQFDYIVIGSGSAGKRAAIQASKLGQKVLLVEKHDIVGGVTVHTGTIPSKTLRETVLYLSGWRMRGFYGENYKVNHQITADDLKQRLSVTLRHEVEVLEGQLMRNNVTIAHGLASFKSDKEVEVALNNGEKEVYKANKILICAGTRPHKPADLPFDGKQVIDSDEILSLDTIPRSLLVYGAGVIGLEYATIYNALDVDVTIIDGRDSMLGFVDREIMDEFTHHLRERGMNIRLGENIAEMYKRKDGKIQTKLDSGKTIVTELVLVAAGRQGLSDTLSLENAGLSADKRGQISVNEFYQTEVPHIYAAGDIIGFPSLASTSMEQGRKAACHAFNHKCTHQLDIFPYGIYSVPEISMVGLSEEDCKSKNIPYDIGVASFREIARGQIMGLREGKLKIIFDLKEHKILGIHIVGEGATELVHIGQAVMAFGGTLDYFIDAVFNYPTLAEAYKIAALDGWNRTHH
ncbi:MAG: Si-specific NAD(P)(+) transhydrogenase [Gammaproteobacteria bacterium]|nr:Si-specific NAD(P)(+) transhydrogenase [Gammaproteobacteria bacterium]